MSATFHDCVDKRWSTSDVAPCTCLVEERDEAAVVPLHEVADHRVVEELDVLPLDALPHVLLLRGDSMLLSIFLIWYTGEGLLAGMG